MDHAQFETRVWLYHDLERKCGLGFANGRFEPAPAAPDDPTPVEAMTHRLKTPEGRPLYALRKQTPEPVFGIIKSVLGFRQFSLRGLEKVRGEWSLVTMAWNLERMFALAPPVEGGAPPARRISISVVDPPDPIATPTKSDRAPAAATRERQFDDQLEDLSPTGC